MADDILTRIDVDSAEALIAISALGKSYDKLEVQTALAAKSQAKYDAAVAKSGATADAAVAAQGRLAAALKREQLARDQVAIATARDAEVQSRATAKLAAAEEAAAAKRAVAMKKIGTVSGTVGLAAAAGLALAAKAASDFNAKMAQVQSLTRGSSSEVAALADATKGYAGIGVSASEAADAEIELVKAGVSAKDILGGALTGTLNAAAAGQIDVAQATEIASAAMVQFGLAGKDIPHVADLLAAGADKSLGGVSDLGEGLKAVGTTAHQFGLSIDQTVGALSQFAAAGLTGSLGGTALKQALLKLEAPSSKAATLMQQYGISLYDAQGHTVTLANLAGQLQTSFKGVSAETRNAALATLFGSRAVQVANVLYKDGAKQTQEWVNKVNDSGFAAEQAAGKMDSLQGDMQKLSAEFTNFAIDTGQQLQPVLRAVTQDLTKFVGFIDDIPGPLKEAAALTLAFTAAVGLGTFVYTRATAALASMATTLGLVGKQGVTAAAGMEATSVAASGISGKMLAIRGGAAVAGIGLTTLSGHISESNETLGGLTQAAGLAALGFSVAGPFGAAVGGAAGLMMNLKTAGFEASEGMNALNKSLAETGTLSAQSKQGAGVVSDQYLGLLDKVGLSAKTYTQALLGNADAQGAVVLAAKQLGPAGALLVQPMDDASKAADDYANHLFLLAQQIHKVTPKQAELGNATRAMGGLMLDTAGDLLLHGAAAKSAAGDVDGLTDAEKDAAAATETLTAFLKSNQAVLSERAAIRAYADAVKSVDDAQKKGGVSIRQQNELLDAQASAALNAADQMVDGSKQQITYLEKSRTALYEQKLEFGYTKAEARAYVDQVLEIPKEWKTKVDIDTLAAAEQLRRLRAQEEAMRTFTIQVNYSIQQTTGFTPGGHVVYDGAATGGEIRGRGTGTSDSNLIRASRGEHMLAERDVKAMGGQAQVFAFRRSLHSIQGLAAGGVPGAPRVVMPAGGSGGSRTVYMTDPALLAAVRRVEDRLAAGIATTETHPERIAAGMQSIARGEVDSSAQRDARMRRMRPS